MEPAQKRSSSWPVSLVAGPAILLTPFAVFIQHHSYGFARPEVLVCAAVLGSVGVLLGVLLHSGGPVLRTLVLSLSLAFVIDVQVEWEGAWNVWALGIFAALSAGAWLLGAFAIRAAAFLFGIVLVATLVLPGGSPALRERGERVPPAPGPDAPPLFIHIVLDEQTGPEGIPARFDPDGHAARALRDFYVSRGFEVFGRAYSRYANTVNSMVNLLNFSADTPGPCCPLSLSTNAYFKEMRRRGYSIHVYQSDFLDYCGIGSTFDVDYCLTYDTERISAFAESDLAVSAKAELIGGMFTRLSFLLEELRRAYSALRARLPGLPAWEDSDGRTSSLSSLYLLPRVGRDLVEAGPGQLFFVHLMIPHSPYAFDQACTLRPDPGDWLLNHDGTDGLWRNSVASRALRYPLYLEQVECLHTRLGELFSELEDRGLLDDAVVLVHGDHGSRISVSYGRSKPWHRSAWADSFSTLFAIKRPGGSGRYDRRLLALDRLFTMLVPDPMLPDGTSWAGAPSVFVSRQPKPFPGFGRDLDADGS